MPKVLTPDLPRVICDKCFKEADVEYVPSRLDIAGSYYGQDRIRCHDREELIGHNNWPRDHNGQEMASYLWSQIQARFETKLELDRAEGVRLKELLGLVRELASIHRIRRNHDEPPTKVDRAVIDETIDTLVLFRPEGE